MEIHIADLSLGLHHDDLGAIRLSKVSRYLCPHPVSARRQNGEPVTAMIIGLGGPNQTQILRCVEQDLCGNNLSGQVFG